MNSLLLTVAARQHITRMMQTIAAKAPELDRRFAAALRARDYHADQVRAFLAITPAAAARVGAIHPFLEQVEFYGKRLAKLNIEPGEAKSVLDQFGGLLDPLLNGRFGPAREQLSLATMMALRDAFFQVREAESQAFFGLYRAESMATGMEELLRQFVRILTRTFHARAGRLLLLDQPVAGKLARPLFIDRGRPEERLIADERMRGRYVSYWSFPIADAGLLQFGFDERSPWLPRELALLAAVGERCKEAIEKAHMHARIRALEAEARRSEEEERRRIARELHDEAGQSLLWLRLQLEMIERKASGEMRQQLVEARGVAERTVEELRRIVAALSPAVLERLGLAAALRQMAARLRRMHPMTMRVRISGSWSEVPRQAQEVIYRVAQESLQNIVKHSQAAHVNLSLSSTDRKLRLSVVDNGAGFCAETALGKPMSFGLTGMRERAALLGGTLAIRSAPGEGAAIVLELPKNSATVNPHGKNSSITD